MRQMSLVETEYTISAEKSRKGNFLTEMERILPLSRLLQLIEPFYVKVPPKAGRRPYALDVMLRIYLMQNWFNLSDPLMESELYDSMAMRKYAQLGGLHNPTPDETTILHFRHLVEANDLGPKLFNEVNSYLIDLGFTMSNGTIVDATLLRAPNSVKNKDHARDPEMASTKKGNQYYFGAKAHVGVDARSGLIHSVIITSANIHDINKADELVRKTDDYVLADSGYRGIEKRTIHKDKHFFISMMHSQRRHYKGSVIDRIEKFKSGLRAIVEHSFRIIKDQFQFRKLRYKGIYKNSQAIIVKCALANLYHIKKQLLQRA